MSVRGEIPYSDKSSDGNLGYALGQFDSEDTYIEIHTTLAEDFAFSPNSLDKRLGEIDERIRIVENRKRPEQEQVKQLRQLLTDFTEKVMLARELDGQLESSFHIQPARRELDRIVEKSNLPAKSVGQDGRFAVAHLQRIKTEETEKYMFLLPHLRNVAGIESVVFETISEELMQAFAKNSETEANVLIADYGFGVSQCLPVLVQGTMMSPNSSLIVEQPEAQIHPTAQLELGSFFADLWTKRNVSSIIETHSSNILLRIRRLVAKGELSHKDISVAYFTFDEDRGNVPVVKNLDIYEDGTMEAGLPMEFFGADITEGLQLGARA